MSVKGLVARWHAEEYPALVRERGEIIARACRDEAVKIAHRSNAETIPYPVRLSAKQVQCCEDRVVSAERNLRFGHGPIRLEQAELWQQQIDHCRALLRAGQRPSDEGIAKDESNAAPRGTQPFTPPQTAGTPPQPSLSAACGGEGADPYWDAEPEGEQYER